MEAGNYGVPQSRHRVIILAAAPGEVLPLYPEPTHVFTSKSNSIRVNVNGRGVSCKHSIPESVVKLTVFSSLQLRLILIHGFFSIVYQKKLQFLLTVRNSKIRNKFEESVLNFAFLKFVRYRRCSDSRTQFIEPIYKKRSLLIGQYFFFWPCCATLSKPARYFATSTHVYKLNAVISHVSSWNCN